MGTLILEVSHHDTFINDIHIIFFLNENELREIIIAIFRLKKPKTLYPYIYSKTCLKPPLKKKTKIGFQYQLSLNAGQKYCRMPSWSILRYFWPSLSYHLSLRRLFFLFLSGRLRQVLLYYYQPKCFLYKLSNAHFNPCFCKICHWSISPECQDNRTHLKYISSQIFGNRSALLLSNKLHISTFTSKLVIFSP